MRVIATKKWKSKKPVTCGADQIAGLRLSLVWEPRDLWVGLYYDAQDFSKFKHSWRPWQAPWITMYVCIIPTLPLKIERIK